MASINRLSDTPVRFVGIGGEHMISEGLRPLFPMSELSVMGVAEIVPHMTRLMRRISETAEAVEGAQPDMLITIDAPAFCLRVLKRLRKLAITRVHYVAPTVWAWRASRARRLAALVDHLMVLLPFEPPYFEAVGLSTTFVGHPVVETDVGRVAGDSFRRSHRIEAEAPLLCLLPGSRKGELKYLLPPFKEAVTRLCGQFPGLRIVLPTIGNLEHILKGEVRNWPSQVVVVSGETEKFGAMAASNVSLAASGTVALELALFGVPNVIAYRLHPVTVAIVRRMIRVKYANLVNLLLDRQAVPEFIQERCRGDLLSDAVGTLLTDTTVRDRQQKAMAEAIAMLSSGTETPSVRAAKVVLGLIGEPPKIGSAAK